MWNRWQSTCPQEVSTTLNESSLFTSPDCSSTRFRYPARRLHLIQLSNRDDGLFLSETIEALSFDNWLATQL